MDRSRVRSFSSTVSLAALVPLAALALGCEPPYARAELGGHRSGSAAGSEAVVAGGGVPGGAVAAVRAGAGAALAVERYRIPLADAPARGPEDAKVTIIEFMDYQCPYCRKAEATLAELEQAYPGDVRVQVVNNPLPMHEHASLAAQAVIAAGRQGKYWEMHTRLLRARGELDRDALEKHAAALGLDVGKFCGDMDSSATTAELAREAELGKRFGIRGTPLFFVNGRKLMGARPFADFRVVIEEEIAAANALIARGVAPKAVYASLTAGGLDGEVPVAEAAGEEPSCAKSDCDCDQP